MAADPRIKMILGALLIVLGVWWYLPGNMFDSIFSSHTMLTNLQSLMVVVQAWAGIVALFTGLFVVWIMRDQIRAEKELRSQEIGHKINRTVQTVAEGGEDEAPEQAETFQCDECGKVFDSERGLNVHVSKVHE